MNPTTFLREDLSRPENRVNTALFGALGIGEFRQAFLTALDLDQSALVFPPANTVGASGGIRPDFCVSVGESVVAWIEVELGSDQRQLTRYRNDLPQRVFAIWGLEMQGVDLTLRDLVAIVRQAASRCDGQQSLQLEHLARVIEEGLSLGGYQQRTAVSEKMRESPFYAAFDRLIGGIRTVSSFNPRGFVYSDSVSAHGFSIRVASVRSTSSGRTVSVFSRRAGQLYLQFEGRGHLEKYLPGRSAEIDALATFLAGLGVDLDAESQADRRLELSIAEQHVEELAALVGRLAR